MTRAWDKVEELRARIEEVKNLRDEEEKHGFAEVTEYSHYRKGHSCEIAVGVSYKHA